MALVKFDRTKTVAQATASTRDDDTLYLPTNEQAIYFKGKRVGGDNVSTASGAGYIYYIGNSGNLDDIFIYKYTANTGTANLPPSELIGAAAEYGDIDITVQMFTMSNPSHAFKQVCEMVWPNGTNSSNADIQPTYEKWERIKVGSTFYEWQKVYSSEASERPLELYFDCDVNNAGSGNMHEYLADGDWTHSNNMPSIITSQIYDYVKNGGHDIIMHLQHTVEFDGSAVVKSISVLHQYYDGTRTVTVVWGNGTNSVTTIEQYE